MRLFHISEQPGIEIFQPRSSPSKFKGLARDVVFAISHQMLHNYLLPRDCPRVTWYAGPQTTEADNARFLGETDFVIAVEWGWLQHILDSTLYCYEFAPDNFTLLDECAGYYVSYQPEVPISVSVVPDILQALRERGVELRFTPSLSGLGEAVCGSSLCFSLIRMRNAGG